MENQALQRIKIRLSEYEDLHQIEQLCLDSIQFSHFTEPIARQIHPCVNILYLTCNHCGLSVLSNFPALPNLLALELIGNQIPGSQIGFLTHNATLEHLALDQNRIEHIADLAPLNNLPNIEHLEVRGNPICQMGNYRALIFELVGKLKIVDSQDVFGDEDVMLQTETDSNHTDGHLDEEQDDDDEDGCYGGRKVREF